MERDIFVIRHGNAYFDSFGEIDDIDRNLDIEGIQEAITIGECLKDKGYLFDKVFTSSAARALQTAVIISRTLKVNMKQIEIKSELYLANVKSIIEVIKNTDNACKSIAIFSHNPGVSDLAWKTKQRINVATCGVLHYQVDIENLSELELDSLRLLNYCTPENH